jgi:hyaluronan synthase/N-acetylglucosaminyltransferase
MTSLAIQLLKHILHVTFALYALLVITHFLLQTGFAHRHHRAVRRSRRLPDDRYQPNVDVVVAAYNEDPASLRDCFDSLLKQDYQGELRVYVVDDCSPNREQLLPLYNQYAMLPGWQILVPDQNRGKRHAQDLVYRECRGEILVTIDSDTIVAPDGIRQIVRPFHAGRVGAVTGDVGVTNWRTNILTRLIGMRYWIAFNQERAAQSFFRSVLCCSGPLAAYRRSVLAAGCWQDYISQSFRGVACTYGDDRHLTNLVLASGSDTLFVPAATAITNAPETLSGYLKQQLRWNKSFYRELLWTVPFLLHRSRYMVFEVIVQTLLPLLLMLAITSSLIYSVLVSPRHLLHYGVAITVMAIVRTGYAIYRTRRPSFLLFVLYGFLHATLLVPLRIRALTTLTDNRWGTRTAVQGPAGAT